MKKMSSLVYYPVNKYREYLFYNRKDIIKGIPTIFMIAGIISIGYYAYTLYITLPYGFISHHIIMIGVSISIILWLINPFFWSNGTFDVKEKGAYYVPYCDNGDSIMIHIERFIEEEEAWDFVNKIKSISTGVTSKDEIIESEAIEAYKKTGDFYRLTDAYRFKKSDENVLVYKIPDGYKNQWSLVMVIIVICMWLIFGIGGGMEGSN